MPNGLATQARGVAFAPVGPPGIPTLKKAFQRGREYDTSVSRATYALIKLRQRERRPVTLGKCGEKRLCFGDLRKFRRRRKAFERRPENGLRVGGAVACLIEFRQGQSGPQL